MENCKHVILNRRTCVTCVLCVRKCACVCVRKGFYVKRIVLEAYILPGRTRFSYTGTRVSWVLLWQDTDSS